MAKTRSRDRGQPSAGASARLRHARPHRGIALILVMWVLALLATMAAAVMATHRTESALARNLVASSQGRALAEAGVYLAIGRLMLEGKDDTEKWIDGNPKTLNFAGSEFRVWAAAESGKIDLNAASVELLKGLLETAGVTGDEADALGDAILDWRDRNTETHLNGAEDREYWDAGRTFGAKDEYFGSVGELGRVLGMTPEVFDKIAPALTVYSGRSKVNPIFASSLVLRALPGMSADQVDQYLESRAAARETGDPIPPLVGAGSAYAQEGSERVFRITTEVAGEGAAPFRVETVVKVTGRKYQILAWELNR